MSEQQQRKHRNKFDWRYDYTRLDDGSFAYKGQVWHYTGGMPWKKLLVCLWGAASVPGLCCIVCGTLPVSGMKNTFYIILPWLVSFVLWGWTCIALCRMTSAGEEMKEHVYRISAAALPLRAGLLCLFSAAAAVLQGLEPLLSPDAGWSPAKTAFVLLMLAAALCAGLLLLLSRRMTFAPEGQTQELTAE